ncbi:MAG TPA: XrtA system polysaccharide chain length determinant, partial [Steroidobacteraceae bacterium]|nr:XrtA system polysaccharide chain length determinant [Steroidobacteraceae bacterium]
MREIVAQLVGEAHGAWRFRWYALALAWIVALGGWSVVVLMPPVYEGRARVYVDTDSVLKPLLNGLTVNADTENRVNMMARMIMARPNLERVARETDLSVRAHSPEAFDELVNGLARRVTLESGNGGAPVVGGNTNNVYGLNANNLYTLRVTDPDPTMALRIVQRLLDAFVEDTLGVKRADSDRAQTFLQTQIHDYEQKLRTAEDRLADFKQHKMGLLPGQSGDYYTRLQTEQSKLQDLQAKYRLALQTRTELAKQLEGEEPTFGLMSGGSGGDTGNPQIDELRHELSQLLLTYTDKHPKVIALKATIAQLEAQAAAGRKARSGSGAALTRSNAATLALDVNPVYQNLRLEQSRNEVALAELRQEVAEEEHVVGDLKARVNTIPQIEAELTQLTRDYEVTKAEYTALVQRLESARLSDQVDTSTNPVKFRIIEPPTKPLAPVGPKRLLLASATLLVALAMGAGLAVVLNQLRPIFLSRSLLGAVTGLPVLGSVSFVPQGRQDREPLLV